MRALLLLLGISCATILHAQPAAIHANDRSPQLFSLRTTLWPTSFLQERQDYSVSWRQGNLWSARFRSLAFAYERGFRQLDRRLRLRTELAYYEYSLVDYRGGVFSNPIPFSEWEGDILLLAPSIVAVPTVEVPIKPVLGLGLMWSIPLGDRLVYEYSEAEQSSAGSPRITVQQNGVLPGLGVFIQGGGRLRLGAHWQLGLHLKVLSLQQADGYLDRRGAYLPTSHLDSRSLFSRKMHYWSQLELSYRI